MKPVTCLIRFLCVCILLVSAAGCASGTRQTESLLAASGFKVVPATTPEQLKQLATLPADKVSVIKRNSQVYFVFPDPAQKQLYVGRDAQYDAYQNLRLNQQGMQQAIQASRAASNAEVLNAEATALSNDPWGAYGVWPVGVWPWE